MNDRLRQAIEKAQMAVCEATINGDRDLADLERGILSKLYAEKERQGKELRSFLESVEQSRQEYRDAIAQKDAAVKQFHSDLEKTGLL